MKEIVTEKVIKYTKYIGNCPVCGIVQQNDVKFWVDTECKDCRNKRFSRVIEYLNSLGFNIEVYGMNNITELSFKFEDVEYNINSYDSEMYIDD